MDQNSNVRGLMDQLAMKSPVFSDEFGSAATTTISRPISSRRTPAQPTFSSLVAKHTVDLPGTDWLTRLTIDKRRENVRCLPLSFRAAKRLFDIVAALGLMVALSPVLLITAVMVKITSPGPIIYSQTRIGLNLRSKAQQDRRASMVLLSDSENRRQPGRDRRELSNFGRPFTIYKFRTMRTDAERHGAQLAQQGDSRVTHIGRLLRRTRIDELPQLWNILKGDMSLIGPRPERPEFMQQLQQHIPNFMDRLGLKPGMTGIAQVVNGYDNDLEGFRRKVSYDLLYLQNCCAWNDLKILFRTIRVVITGEGAL
jgi:lipopolysaccharide/colanic/teichoic acid biosynthesis glycosyltransferase